VRVKVKKNHIRKYLAFVGRISAKTLIDLYETPTRRLAGKLAEKALDRLKHHPRKLRARGLIK
jgi:hypothetical protein